MSSTNKGEWIQNLIADYKKNLNERKINLDDDYIKFIRYAEHYVEKTGYGIVAMITNNSFLDGVTHRQMRKHLLETFDTIYIYDLHGSAKKKETAPDGSKDENVFDIQQGVSISVFVKTAQNNKKLADVYHADAYGLREDKYTKLKKENLKTTSFSKIEYEEPYYFFVPKDFSSQDEYEKGFPLNTLMPLVNSGIQTDRDSLFIDFDKEILIDRMQTLLSGDLPFKFVEEYRVKDSGSYKITSIIKGKKYEELFIHSEQYRPFDYRHIYYDPSIISRSAFEVSKNFVGRNNIGFQVSRQQSTYDFQHILASKHIVDRNSISLQTREATYFFPLYRYETVLSDVEQKVPNLDERIYAKIKKVVSDLTPENLFDYIYAVLHASAYRERYKEFLKSDFPRIPYPKDAKIFHVLAEKGAELRALHLMESPALDNRITTYPVDGNHAVDKPIYKDGNVWINDDQYFGSVPEIAWNFYIGGYQPAQKWLKDRRSRNLSIDDIMHYQRIIVALTETHRIMQEIDTIKFLLDEK